VLPFCGSSRAPVSDAFDSMSVKEFKCVTRKRVSRFPFAWGGMIDPEFVDPAGLA